MERINDYIDLQENKYLLVSDTIPLNQHSNT